MRPLPAALVLLLALGSSAAGPTVEVAERAEIAEIAEGDAAWARRAGFG